MVDLSKTTHQRQDSEHVWTLSSHFLQSLQVTWGLCVIRTAASTDHECGTKFPTVFAHLWSESFHNKTSWTLGQLTKKKEKKIHDDTEALATG